MLKLLAHRTLSGVMHWTFLCTYSPWFLNFRRKHMIIYVELENDRDREFSKKKEQSNQHQAIYYIEKMNIGEFYCIWYNF